MGYPIGMSEVEYLKAKAAQIAASNSPLHVLDTAVLGLLVGIGWLAGRAWWLTVFLTVFASKGLVAYILAIRHGYRQGTKKTLTAAPKQPEQPVPAPELMQDDRITDYATPFGVPFGPNVQAFSEPA